MQITKILLFAWLILVNALEAFCQSDSVSVEVELIKNELIFTEAPFKQCHASSLVELSNGRIMVVWFAGTYERHPDVCIWGSVRNPEGWSEPILLADGVANDTLRYPCWNPVLFKSNCGVLFLFYKVGPSPGDWWGMFKKSTDDGQTWSAPNKLPEGILGPVKNKPVYTSGGRVISPSSIENGDFWNAHIELSDDDGYSWSKVLLDTTTGYKMIQPTLLILHDGIILALMRSDQNCIIESRSTDNGNTWSKPLKTGIMNPNSGIDGVTLNNGLQVLVCNPDTAGKEWVEGRNKLVVMVSADGECWNEAYHLEDNTSGEYSYPAIIQSHDGLVHITYTSNREFIRNVVLKIKP